MIPAAIVIAWALLAFVLAIAGVAHTVKCDGQRSPGLCDISCLPTPVGRTRGRVSHELTIQLYPGAGARLRAAIFEQLAARARKP